jgi:excisionase family DNA binding protein
MDGHKSDDGPSRLWNVGEVAAFLRTSAGAVYKLVERRGIPHVRLGRRVLFDSRAIHKWIERHHVVAGIANHDGNA